MLPALYGSIIFVLTRVDVHVQTTVLSRIFKFYFLTILSLSWYVTDR